MPISLVQSYARWLPRLQAEEAMQEATIIAVGGGKLKKGESRRIMAAWKRQAGVRPNRVQSAGEVKSMLAAIGVDTSKG